MSLRSSFKFKYPVSKILPVIRDKQKHHGEREKHYQEEYAKAEKDLKENGIVMMEGAASVASGNITGYGLGGKSMYPLVSQEKTDVVNRARDKVGEHRNLAAEYKKYGDAFSAALEMNKDALIKIDSDDVKFFGIGTEEVK